MNEYDIIVQESKTGLNIRAATKRYPKGFRKLGTLKAENIADAAEELKQRLYHAIIEEWISL